MNKNQRTIGFILVIFLGILLGNGIGIAEEKSTVRVVSAFPLTGTNAAWGTKALEGVRLGIEQINTAGGLLGKQLELEPLDTQGKPPVSVAAMKKAVTLEPYVVFGTVMSGSTIVNMWTLEKAGIPQFVGSRATTITEQGNKNIFRTTLSSKRVVEKSKDWIVNVLGSRKLAIIYISDEYGITTLDDLVEALKGEKTEIVEKIAVEHGQVDFTGQLVKIQQSEADVLFTILHGEECVKVVKQATKLGLRDKMKIVGAEALVLPAYVKIMQEDAEGLSTIFCEAYDVPSMWPMAVAYKTKYGEFPGNDAIKMYLGVMVAAAGTEKIGVFDQQKLKDYLHGRTLCASQHRWLPVDVHYDENGELDRGSYEVTIKDGKQTVTKSLSPVHPENFAECTSR